MYGNFFRFLSCLNWASAFFLFMSFWDDSDFESLGWGLVSSAVAIWCWRIYKREQQDEQRDTL